MPKVPGVMMALGEFESRWRPNMLEIGWVEWMRSVSASACDASRSSLVRERGGGQLIAIPLTYKLAAGFWIAWTYRARRRRRAGRRFLRRVQPDQH